MYALPPTRPTYFGASSISVKRLTIIGESRCLVDSFRAKLSQPSLIIAERRALREEVRDALIGAIVGGDFPPGERIVESRIARHLGVSQTTVREALREIEQLGLVVSSLNRGVVVRPLTRRAVLEMYEMRALLEGYAARRAVERVTDADLAELESMVSDMVQLGDAGDVREMIARDVEFHTRICALADHTLLARLWASVNPHLWTYVAVRGLLGWSCCVAWTRSTFAVPIRTLSMATTRDFGRGATPLHPGTSGPAQSWLWAWVLTRSVGASATVSPAPATPAAATAGTV